MSIEAVWRTIQLNITATRLGVAEEEERNHAISTLVAGGELSLPILRRTLCQSHLRTQCAAAVALHLLAQPDGMEMLVEALQWRLQSDPSLSSELEAALITIGSPDAVNALLLLWKRTPETGAHRHTLESICRVWATLRDPKVIDALIVRAPRLPELFEETLPAFGEMAIAPLEQMTTLPDASSRLLAVRALRHLNVPRTITLLRPLLRDPDANVRAAVPDALAMTAGHFAAGKLVLEALRDGYSTGAGIQELAFGATAPYDDLIDLVARWKSPATPLLPLGVCGDTVDAVANALRLFTFAPYPHPRIAGVVTELLERKPEVLVVREALVLSANFTRLGTHAQWFSTVVQEYLTYPNADLRQHAAEALARQGEPLGSHLLQFLYENRPNAGILGQLQAVVRGEADPGRVAAQAMQQMSQWVTRLSRETADRLTPTGGKLPLYYRSPQMITLLTRLLENLLTHAMTTQPPEMLSSLTDAIAAMSALARLSPEGRAARPQILRALLSVDLPAVHPSIRAVRSTAASALLALYGTDSFPFFIEALYVPRYDVQPAAIAALVELADIRALPHLQTLAAAPNHPCAALAIEAATAIKRTHPEMMTLLRASTAHDTQPDILLRPILTRPAETAPEELLRPSEQ